MTGDLTERGNLDTETDTERELYTPGKTPCKDKGRTLDNVSTRQRMPSKPAEAREGHRTMFFTVPTN